ncbi:hydroxyacylglutathione hydrolase [Leptospira fluminis]|uniref:hydroxyacylglutathione hydrolase n=1 Tax=Leptospira fluminis TaxID=2484979 RepID=A0A4R9GKV2_9LEPT|nr:hydroxyacylglutathione hydrolase [Leptospira fluminis]TGK14713.1 hydroxyacylglutathione hydrolase [Leptospira fluminis]
MLEIIQIYTASPLRNFSYVIRQTSSGETVCIDPFDSVQISALLKDKHWSLNFIVNTHEHWDHTSGNEGLCREFGSVVLTHPKGMDSVPFASRPLLPGDRILSDPAGLSYLEVLHTPGHTFAHICLLQIENETPTAVFTGDTIFNCGVGNCKNGGNPEVLYRTVSEIFYALPDTVRLYPGHDYLKNNLRFSLHLDPENSKAKAAMERAEGLRENEEFWTTDFGEEREFNPFFLCRNPSLSLVSGIRNRSGKTDLPTDEKTLFLTLRSLRDKW